MIGFKMEFYNQEFELARQKEITSLSVCQTAGNESDTRYFSLQSWDHDAQTILKVLETANKERF